MVQMKRKSQICTDCGNEIENVINNSQSTKCFDKQYDQRNIKSKASPTYKVNEIPSWNSDFMGTKLNSEFPKKMSDKSVHDLTTSNECERFK